MTTNEEREQRIRQLAAQRDRLRRFAFVASALNGRDAESDSDYELYVREWEAAYQDLMSYGDFDGYLPPTMANA